MRLRGAVTMKIAVGKSNGSSTVAGCARLKTVSLRRRDDEMNSLLLYPVKGLLYGRRSLTHERRTYSTDPASGKGKELLTETVQNA